MAEYKKNTVKTDKKLINKLTKRSLVSPENFFDLIKLDRLLNSIAPVK